MIVIFNRIFKSLVVAIIIKQCFMKIKSFLALTDSIPCYGKTTLMLHFNATYNKLLALKCPLGIDAFAHAQMPGIVQKPKEK